MLEFYSVSQVRRWLQLALEALGEAERAFDPEIQAGLRSIADDYLSLAKHAEAKLLAEALNGSRAQIAAGNADHRGLAQASSVSVGRALPVAAN